MTELGLILVGLGAGSLATMLGIGGGIILVPTLGLLFDFSQETAQGTSLVVVATTAVVGTLAYSRRRMIDWSTVRPMAVAAALGGFGGALAARALDPTLLRRLFAVLLVAVAVQMLRGERPTRYQRHGR